MININKIAEAMLHLVGWQKDYSESDFTVANYLAASESGLYFQQVHPLITISNMASIAPPTLGSISRPTYDRRTTYNAGDVVKYSSALFVSLVDNNVNNEPNERADTRYWAITNEFSEWLRGFTLNSIKNAIQRYYTDKLANRTTKALCENRQLFSGTGRLYDVIEYVYKNFVGFEIIPARYNGVTLKINKLCLHFAEKQNFVIYIFHSSCLEPIYKFKVMSLANQPTWIDLDDVFLPFVNGTGNIGETRSGIGGSWYIGYYQWEAPHAIRKMKDWSQKPCGSCNKYDYESWEQISRYLEIYPFKTEVDNQDNLWDIEDNIYTYDTNYGLNLDVSIICDLTDFIISNSEMFIDVIMKQLGIEAMKQFIYNANVRTNRHSINASRQDIIFAVDGDTTKLDSKSGLAYELEQAYKAIDISTRGISKVCLPCKNNGIKYRTV